jgi:hypothetical protein
MVITGSALLAPSCGGDEMGGGEKVAEEAGYCQKQIGREDQGVGGCPETRILV